jgi:uncharacterized protein with ParB-like and HNH nuclease domain
MEDGSMSGKIELKPIKALFNMSFFIPDYQRGYRWGEQQVKDLLRDLDEFKESVDKEGNPQRIYCLQPLVAMKKDDKYSVIDGQQRLTTIKILLSCLREKETYSVEYQTRDKSEDFLNKIIEQRDNGSWKENADFFHMYRAKETICEWLENKNPEYKQAFLTIVKEKVNFVWYESDDPDPIKVFTRLNIGKIGLTESELIKALFLSSNNFCATETTEAKLLTLVEIANEWDRIEYRLQDDRFWLFFHSTEYNKPTRIDYILDIARKMDEVYNNQYDGEMYPTFRYYYDHFNKASNKQSFLSDQWKNISRIYQILEEWYNDEELYHYIGFLCALSKCDEVFHFISVYLGEKAVQIKKRESEKILESKEAFIRYLKYRIKYKCGKALDFDLQYEGEKQPKKTEARPVLLLHNVQTVLDQNASIVGEKKYSLPDFVRFPFHLFKKEGWDVEHIRPNSIEDFEGERKKTARKKYVYVLRQYQDDAIKALLDKYDSDSKTEPSDDQMEQPEESAFVWLWKKINGNGEDSKELQEELKNLIWNYTLLDSSTNREYGNSCFAIKRDYVLKKEKGIKPQLSIDDKDEVKISYEKEAAFVPVCTRNVFSKAYTDYPDDLKYWTQKDAAYYRMDMEKTLWWYLFEEPGELTDEAKRIELFKKYRCNILDGGKYNVSFKKWYENYQKGGL